MLGEAYAEQAETGNDADRADDIGETAPRIVDGRKHADPQEDHDQQHRQIKAHVDVMFGSSGHDPPGTTTDQTKRTNSQSTKNW